MRLVFPLQIKSNKDVNIYGYINCGSYNEDIIDSIQNKFNISLSKPIIKNNKIICNISSENKIVDNKDAVLMHLNSINRPPIDIINIPPLVVIDKLFIMTKEDGVPKTKQVKNLI